jgi:hypothetical protein
MYYTEQEREEAKSEIAPKRSTEEREEERRREFELLKERMTKSS